MSDKQYNPVACNHKHENGFSAWSFQSEEQSNLGGQNKVSIHVCVLCGEISIGGYRPSKDETHVNSFHETFNIYHPAAIDAIIKQANFYNEKEIWGRLHPSESAGASAVWMKSQYDQLYEQVKGGNQTVCYVDYNAWGTDSVYRDICTIRAETMEFTSRGHGYGKAKYVSGNEKDLFIQLCESIHVEWLRESPGAQGREDAVLNLFRRILNQTKHGNNTSEIDRLPAIARLAKQGIEIMNPGDVALDD